MTQRLRDRTFTKNHELCRQRIWIGNVELEGAPAIALLSHRPFKPIENVVLSPWWVCRL
jgi:hypothetical protein